MLIHIGYEIVMQTPKDSKLVKAIIAAFTIPNPEYIVRQKLKKSVYGISKTLLLLRYGSGFMRFNKGDLNKIVGLLKAFDIQPNIVDKTTDGIDTVFEWNKDIVLRDYQKKASDTATTMLRGSIIMPAGSGKTITGMDIIQKTGKKCLWVTHTKDLLYQSADNCLKCLGYKPGIIGDGKKDIKDITIATIQTLSKSDDLINELNNQIGLIIVDEAHHVPTTYFTSVLSKFSTKRVIGLTATPDRKDDMQALMYSAIGEEIYRINRKILYDE